jgi:hypothetical protein
MILDAKTADAVRAKVDLALKAEAFCRDWRNNRIGHNNLDQRVNPAARPLRSASRKQVDEVLAALAAVLNVIAAHSEIGFAHVMPPRGDATALLYVLRDGLDARQERQARREFGPPDEL